MIVHIAIDNKDETAFHFLTEGTGMPGELSKRVSFRK